MWTFEQSTGMIFDATGKLIEIGYSGHGEGFNNPDMQDVPMIGPIPCGLYSMGPLHNQVHVGKDVMQLFPHDANKMFGRSGFFWHGDEIAHPGEHLASDGCPVHSKSTRIDAYRSGDHIFQVVSRFKMQINLPLENSK